MRQSKLSGSCGSGLEGNGLRLSDLRLRLSVELLLRYSRLRLLSVKLLSCEGRLRLWDSWLRLSVDLLRHSRSRLSDDLLRLRHSRLRSAKHLRLLRHSRLRLSDVLLRLRHSRLRLRNGRLGLEWKWSGLSCCLLLGLEMGEGLNLLDRLLRGWPGLLPYQFLDRQESLLINVLTDITDLRWPADNLGSGQCPHFGNVWHPELLLGRLLPHQTHPVVTKHSQLGRVKDAGQRLTKGLLAGLIA